MMNQRQHVRLPVEGSGKFAMTIIPFKTLDKIDITADAVDRGAGGLGINADRLLEPGFVVIRDNRREGKNGVLVWTKEGVDRSCRAGIQFVPNNEKEAERLRSRVEPTFAYPAVRDPELFASLIMDVVERLEVRRGIGSASGVRG